ncbi:protein S100-A9 [Dromiciops gliroides]|uniref:protein S100-A9 n=1 Tax=Dromiciops gliroides TaxID=33562 RepID=UPI001CC50296|nr:protein S100-A9 [Dromiciops gliroides]
MENCSMQNALKIIVDTFHHYSARVGNPDALNKREMRQLLNKEMPHFVKNAKDLQDVPNLFRELDTNQDEDIDFKEFAVMVARLTMATHEKMHENACDKDHHSHGPGLEGPPKGQGCPK